jgi:hypothetical protein
MLKILSDNTYIINEINRLYKETISHDLQVAYLTDVMNYFFEIIPDLTPEECEKNLREERFGRIFEIDKIEYVVIF